MSDEALAALGITALVVAAQESPLPATHPLVYRGARAGLAIGAAVMITRPSRWQRLALTAAGVWGAAELISVSYSVLLMGADTLLLQINRLTRPRRP